MANDELKVGGYSVGGRDLMDPELTGSNVRDVETGRFHDKAPVSKIADAIRSGSTAQGGGFGVKTGAAVSSKAAAVMMQNMQPIMKQLQTLTESNPEFADEISKLMDLFKESHKYNAKEFSEKASELLGQIERIKLSAGNDEQAQQIAQQLTAGLGDQIKGEARFGGISGRVREAFNVDAGVGFKEQFKQAFSMERMFGAKGGFGAAESKARGDYEREKQAKDIGLSLGDEGIKVTSSTEGSFVPERSKGTAKKKGGLFSGGIDRESFAEQQVEKLQEIIDVLHQIKDGGGMGGGGGPSILPTRVPRPGGKLSLRQRLMNKIKGVKPTAGVAGAADDVAKAGANVADDVAKAGTAVKPGMGGKALNVLGKAAVPLAVAGSIYEGYQGYNEADQLVESGAINEETGQAFTEADETAGKTEAVAGAAGGLAGGLGGAKAGALAGAALGSFVPGVGTAIGGVVGGLVGGVAGYFGGKALGEGLGDAVTETSGEAALQAAEDSGLYDKDMLGNSEIDPEILAQTTDPAQLQAIIADDDLSDEDMNMVKSRLAEIKDFEAGRSGELGLGGDSTITNEKKVGGVTVERNGEKVALTQAEIEQVNMANNAATAMGNDAYDVSKNPIAGESSKRGREIPTQGQNIYQAEKQTGNAVARATEGAADSGSAPAPVVNNISSGGGSKPTPPPIVTAPISVRPGSSTIQRYQDSRFAG